MTWAAMLWVMFVQLAGVPTGEALLKRVEAAMESVRDYTVTLDITADLEQANIPPMQAKMYFKQPDKVHVESQGFALLPREALGFSPSRLLERFRVESVTSVDVEGRKNYRLQLAPRDERARVRTTWLEISPEHWTIERCELSFADDRTVTVGFKHEQVGSVWLPSELSLSFASSPRTIRESSPLDDQKLVQAGRGTLRKGNVIIRYSGYQLNTGLPDSIFTSSSAGAAR
jgi:outer membrane lipoprotein-sorting protein